MTASAVIRLTIACTDVRGRDPESPQACGGEGALQFLEAAAALLEHDVARECDAREECLPRLRAEKRQRQRREHCDRDRRRRYRAPSAGGDQKNRHEQSVLRLVGHQAEQHAGEDRTPTRASAMRLPAAPRVRNPFWPLVRFTSAPGKAIASQSESRLG